MTHNTRKTVGTTLVAGLILLASNLAPHSMAAEAPNAKNDTRKFLYDSQTKKTYGPKAPVVWEKPTKVEFSHKVHTMDAGLSCESCHNDIFTMKSGAVLASGEMTMAAMAEGKFCGTCHDGSTAFATNTKCSSCHTDMKEIIPKDPIVWTHPVKAVTFDHMAHTDAFGLDCESCHDEVFAMKKGAAEKADNFTMQALYEGKYCGKCHDGSTAFASNTRCNSCHIGVKGHNRMTGNDGGHDNTHNKTKAGH